MNKLQIELPDLLLKKRVLAAGLQERFHGRRPLAAMKPFLAGGVSCFKKSSSQRFLKKNSLFSASSANSSEAGETKNLSLTERTEHAEHPYDLIHVHSVPDFEVFAAWLPKLKGAKIILDIHDIVPELYAAKFGTGEGSLFYKLLVLLEKLNGYILYLKRRKAEDGN